MTTNDNQMTKFFGAKISLGKDKDIQNTEYASIALLRSLYFLLRKKCGLLRSLYFCLRKKRALIRSLHFRLLNKCALIRSL